jgi:hypothetical protein
MSTEHREIDQTALAARLNRMWGNFKQGKLIGYRVMALFLILIAVVFTVWYITHERSKANSQRWVSLEEASTQSAYEDISKTNPNTLQDRMARFQIARDHLGVNGIELLNAPRPDLRQRGLENVEKAREDLGKLLTEFNDEPVLKAECLLGLAKAEATMVAVPAKEGQLTEFKGSLSKVVEYLDQLAKAVPEDTPWAKDAKKLADSLRDPNSPSAHEFVQVQRSLFMPLTEPGAGSGPKFPGMPGGPGLGELPTDFNPIISGVPQPPTAPGQAPVTPKVEPAPTPQTGAPTTPPAPSTGPAPVAPPPTPPKAPGDATPQTPAAPAGPIAPPAKGPEQPKTPGAGPTPNTGEPPAPIAPPPKK